MTIYGIEGSIGTGKTLSLVYFLYNDAKAGRKILTNINLKLPKPLDNKVVFLNKDKIINIFEELKSGNIDITGSTIGIQEIHNYIDSRNSMSKKNRVFSYFILQSRHFGGRGRGVDIIYDTQDFNQVDVRLRRNTDFYLRPMIVKKKLGKPEIIYLELIGKVGHRLQEFSKTINVYNMLKYYDTHEVVDF